MGYSKFIIGTILSVVVLRLSMMWEAKKDSTAQGIAKIRHLESLLEDPTERLYEDPYAHYMYPLSWIQTSLGGYRSRSIFDFIMNGLFDHLTLRTKFIDDAILSRTSTANQANQQNEQQQHEQLVILGAGYDTRGFRLDLPDGFTVWEVDQPGVQSRKRKIMEGLAVTDKAVEARLGASSSGPHVEFLEVDFNKDSIGERLVSQRTFDQTKPTIVTLEGVTQYIPMSALATTLKQVRNVLAKGSVILISYVYSEVMEQPELACPKTPRKLERTIRLITWSGEPWITYWKTPETFASFLKEIGYEVIEDVTFSDLNKRYLVPVHRDRKDDDLCNLERYVVARVA